jgi:hypothetical protein
MLIKKIMIFFVLSCGFFASIFSQDSGVKVQIREPQKLIGQIDKYIFGNGLHAKESDSFFSPIQKSLLTTIHGFEPLLGVKIELILSLLNGNIDIFFNPEEKIFRFRADYATNEIALNSANVIKTFFASQTKLTLLFI